MYSHTKSIKKIKSTKSTKSTKKIKKNTKINNKISIIPLTKLSKNNIKELADITNDADVMKNIGNGKKWSISDIKTFISDERRESAKSNINRNYYSYAILYNNRVSGYISGRKKKNLLGPPIKTNPLNIILRIFVGKSFQGLGIGKTAVKLFITKYSNILGAKYTPGTYIIADIKKDNIASIKTMLSNDFKYYGEIQYPNLDILNRYVFTL